MAREVRQDYDSLLVNMSKRVDSVQRALANMSAGINPTPPGGSTPPTRYIHVQSTLSSTWTVVHNLGYSPVAIRVVDTAGYEYFGVDRADIDSNSLTLSFGLALTGTATMI